MTNAFILTWNPSRWPWDEDEYAQEVRATSAGKLVDSQWSCGNQRGIVPGDKLYLMRQGTKRGIIGSGIATSEVGSDRHWDSKRSDYANYVEFKSDTLLFDFERLPIETLMKTVLGVPWNNLMASGVRVPDAYVTRLERLWTRHLARLGRSVESAASAAQDFDDPPDEGRSVERALQEIIIRRGQASFRDRLMKAYGAKCAISGCDAPAALEAAHIRPYSQRPSNTLSNGILLRADLHTLFDLDLIGIHPMQLVVVLDASLTQTQYSALNNTPVRLPRRKEYQPSIASLRERWKRFSRVASLSRATSER